MQLPKKLELSSLSVYLPSLIAFFSIAHVGEQSEPFGLALLFALLSVGIPPTLPVLFYILSSLFPFDFFKTVLYGGQAFLLSLAFLIKNKFFTRANQGIEYEAVQQSDRHTEKHERDRMSGKSVLQSRQGFLRGCMLRSS